MSNETAYGGDPLMTSANRDFGFLPREPQPNAANKRKEVPEIGHSTRAESMDAESEGYCSRSSTGMSNETR
jgi:hypothetical protein